MTPPDLARAEAISGAVCIFVKAPEPGNVKTRLAPALGADAAAALARAFFADTLALVQSLGWARPIVATDDDSFGQASGLPDNGTDLAFWSQGCGDLGERLARVLCRALEEAPFAIAIGTDSPGLPARLLHAARAGLRTADACLGPCDDGGFYLLGLRRFPEGLLRGIPWSKAETGKLTIERLESRDLRTTLLEKWFDVDRPDDLDRLRRLLAKGEIQAPRTHEVLLELDATGRRP